VSVDQQLQQPLIVLDLSLAAGRQLKPLVVLHLGLADRRDTVDRQRSAACTAAVPSSIVPGRTTAAIAPTTAARLVRIMGTISFVGSADQSCGTETGAVTPPPVRLSQRTSWVSIRLSGQFRS
jgi:hypothetical protein